MSTVTLAQLPGRPCPIAAALEVIGQRWALLIVREIALGATRFNEIVTGTGAPRDRVAARLKELEAADVVVRVRDQHGSRRESYALSASGTALVPVLDALLAWGDAYAIDPADPDKRRHYPKYPKSAVRQEKK